MNEADNNFYSALNNILLNKKDIVCFYQNINCPSKSALYGNDFLPSHSGNPFNYLASSGIIADESIPAFEIYVAQIEIYTNSPSERDSLSLDFKLNLGKEKLTEVTITSYFLKDESGKVTEIAGKLELIPDSEIRNKEMLRAFTFDRNPKIIQTRIMNLIEKEEGKRKIAFVQFDIERFKLINDNYGSETGDKVLAHIGDVLNILCGDEKPHGRLSSDLFTFVMAFDDKNEIVDFIRLVESRIVGFMNIDFRLCFGVYIMRDGDTKSHPRRYGDNAGMARYKVKGNALANIGFYDDNILIGLHRRQEIEDDMQNALLTNEFLMYLQPKVCISTGKIIGAESLARWNHHSKGLIPPGDFVPVFEKNGFIIKLDRFIWEEACKQIREWMDNGITPIPLSVNVSRAYLGNMSNDTVSEIYELVKKYDIPIELLQLEITESIESSGVDEIIEKFKKKGFTMLMDDFGSGYSSLNMLKTTKFDVLKIDRSFLSEFMESMRGRKIIEHTITMSRDIGLDIIAEGVETSEQAKFLNQCGCDAAQGFYYSKPVDKETFNKMFLENNFPSKIANE